MRSPSLSTFPPRPATSRSRSPRPSPTFARAARPVSPDPNWSSAAQRHFVSFVQEATPMRIDFRKGILAMPLILMFEPAPAQDDIAALRAELEQLRAEYEVRIDALERRLAVAEQNAMQANAAVSQLASEPAAAPSPAPRAQAGIGDSTFNPAIGVIFEGTAWRYGEDPEDYAIQGFPLGGETGPRAEGLALGETEIDMSANVDDKFTAFLTAGIHIEDGEAHFDIEEAWLETLALPGGFSARFGRFFSGIGYLNDKHRHA